jgi:hypothetical protein
MIYSDWGDTYASGWLGVPEPRTWLQGNHFGVLVWLYANGVEITGLHRQGVVPLAPRGPRQGGGSRAIDRHHVDYSEGCWTATARCSLRV